ncbi:hypothetical protein DB346_05345 [Verrucomicrobia bacterium LW23]|nr:hypothetical protein DB346_05345 [Verrucomicrobia bacterium LW23]
MPNQRHPDKALLGLWVSKDLKRRVAELAKRTGKDLSEIGQKALLLGLNEHELKGTPFPKLDDKDQNED